MNFEEAIKIIDVPKYGILVIKTDDLDCETVKGIKYTLETKIKKLE